MFRIREALGTVMPERPRSDISLLSELPQLGKPKK